MSKRSDNSNDEGEEDEDNPYDMQVRNRKKLALSVET